MSSTHTLGLSDRLETLSVRRNVLRYRHEVMELLVNYRWPGNVAELEDVIRQAVRTCEGDTLEKRDLPARLVDVVMRSGFRYPYIPQHKSKMAWRE